MKKLLLAMLACVSTYAAVAPHPRLYPTAPLNTLKAKKAANHADWTAVATAAAALVSKTAPAITIASATNANPAVFTIAEGSFPFTNPANCVTNFNCMELVVGGATGGWAALNNGGSYHGWAISITGAQTFTLYNRTTKIALDSTSWGSFAGQNLTTWLEHGGDATTTFSSGFFQIGYRGDQFYDAAHQLGLVYWAKKQASDGDTATYLAAAKALYNWMAKCGPAGISMPVEPNGRGSGSGYSARFILTGFALLHDLLWPDLTPTERANGAATLNLWATTTEQQGYIALPQAISNFAAGEHQGVTWAGYAMYDEDPVAAQTHIDWSANDWTVNYLPEWSKPAGAVSGNFMWESWQYGGGATARMLKSRMTSAFNGGVPVGTDILKNLATAIVYDRRPDKATTNQDSVNSVTTSVGIMAKNEPLILSYMLSGTTEGGYMQAMLADWGSRPAWSSGATETPSNYDQLLYSDTSRATADYTALPLHFYISGRAAVESRTGWGTSDVWIYRHYGTRQGIDHQVRAPGGWEVVRGSDRLLGGAHNEDNADYANGNAAGGNGLFFLDDNTFNGVSTSNPATQYYGGAQVWGSYTAPVVKIGTDYSYLSNDLTQAYNPLKTNSTVNNQAKRTLLYWFSDSIDLGNGVGIRHDRVKAKLATYTKHFRWHFMAQPVATGTSYKATVGSSAVTVKTLLPATPSINLVRDGTSIAYRIEVSDPVSSTDLHGLTVISADASGATAPAAVLITTDANYTGVQVATATPAVVLFSLPVTAGVNNTFTSTPQTAVAFTSTHSGTARYFVNGLAPATYTTHLGGVVQQSGVTVGADGILTFTGSAGDWQISQGAALPPPPAPPASAPVLVVH